MCKQAGLGGEKRITSIPPYARRGKDDECLVESTETKVKASDACVVVNVSVNKVNVLFTKRKHG